MRKRTDLSISITPPTGAKLDRISIQPDGQVILVDVDGNAVTPANMERTAYYDRAKGPKVQSQVRISDGAASVNGLAELASFASVFVVDTNTRVIAGDRISAACFVNCRLVFEDGGYRLEHEPRLNIYEFHNVTGSAEFLAILKIANDVVRGGLLPAQSVAFVSDCQLGLQQAVSERRTPLYGTHFMPPGFKIFYASSDIGSEFLNEIIRFCDKQSTVYLRQYEEHSLPNTERLVLQEDPAVTYRFMSRSGLEVVNPHLSGVAFGEGSIVRLYGVRKPR